MERTLKLLRAFRDAIKGPDYDALAKAMDERGEEFKIIYPHSAKYYGKSQEFVIEDICKQLDEITTWIQLNTKKKRT